MNIEDRIKQAAENAVVSFITSHNWLQPDYQKRVTVPSDILTDAWARVDVEQIKKHLTTRIEAELADRLMNHMAAEMATDVKQILGVPERREALRAIARAHLETIMKKGLQP